MNGSLPFGEAPLLGVSFAIFTAPVSDLLRKSSQRNEHGCLLRAKSAKLGIKTLQFKESKQPGGGRFETVLAEKHLAPHNLPSLQPPSASHLAGKRRQWTIWLEVEHHGVHTPNAPGERPGQEARELKP